MRKIVIIGGGLAGLISSIQLIRAGLSCTVIEKKSYPFHRVCGEYISNEALPFLTASGLYPNHLDVAKINFFEFTSVSGRSTTMPLDLGGFGVSRYAFDHHLYQIARKEGVNFLLNTEATDITFKQNQFEIRTKDEKFFADVVVGSFGKRSKIDVQLDRTFIKKRSPYVGVKYHARTNHPGNLISLHNFDGGYCGVCNVENGITNICYLTHRDNLKRHKDVRIMENAIISRNPRLADLFSRAAFVLDKPEVINEISFETKSPVENHILMAGDAAGMIAPVCGNGMAIAIHSGKMLAKFIKAFCQEKTDRQTMEQDYSRAWRAQFSTRLAIGRNVQRLFGSRKFSSLGVGVARWSPSLSHYIMSKTHGKPF